MKPFLSPWKHRALSYSEGVECHIDCSCGLMNVGIHSSIHSFFKRMFIERSPLAGYRSRCLGYISG